MTETRPYWLFDGPTFRHPFRWLVWLLDELLDRVPARWEGAWHRMGQWGCRLRLSEWWDEDMIRQRKRRAKGSGEPT